MIVVAGEALVDLVAGDGDGGGSGSAGELRAHPGGGPFNVARTIARLQQPVAYLGALSDDAYGAMLRAALAADGVDLGRVASTALPTTLALAHLGADGSAEYRFYTAATSATALTTPQALVALTEPPDALLLGGLALTLEPVGGALEIAVERIAPRTLVVLDPNCRPGAVDDHDAYRARLHRILRRVDLLKASEEDLAYLVPGMPTLDAARALLNPAAAVIVTRGAEGATVVTDTGEIAIPAPAVEVVDTIGAGDAFGGALLAWWTERGLGREALGDPARLAEAARSAALVAALTCSRAGASPPTRAELLAAGG
jgi:fructokinase